jgi:hypothetical protein
MAHFQVSLRNAETRTARAAVVADPKLARPRLGEVPDIILEETILSCIASPNVVVPLQNAVVRGDPDSSFVVFQRSESLRIGNVGEVYFVKDARIAPG